MAPAFDVGRAHFYVRHIAGSIGTRLAGSDAEAQTARFVRETFEAAGLNVEEHAFPVLTGEASVYRLEALTPDAWESPCAPFVLAGATPEVGVVGEPFWIDAGGGFDGAAGKVALWRLANRSELLLRFDELAARRPLAIVVIWGSAGELPKHQRVSEARARQGGAPPALTIRLEDGDILARLQPSRVRVTLKGTIGESSSCNIIAELRGDAYPDDIIVVGAHTDTAPGTLGAIDNASGLALTLELANAFAAAGSRRTLRFVGWGAEKAGMVGSRRHLETLSARDLAKHKLCISIDGVGAVSATPVCYAVGCDALREFVRAALASGGTEIRTGFYGSDSEMFVQAGIPALSFGQEGPALRYLHTQADNVSKIDPDRLGEVGRTIMDVMCAADASAHWPFETTVQSADRQHAARMLRQMGWLRASGLTRRHVQDGHT